MNHYYHKIFNQNGTLMVNTVYDVGEQNLTNNDVILINNIECFLLEINDNEARFITKNIYNQRFINRNNEFDSATNNILEYLDKFYESNFKNNPYLLDQETTYLFNNYPVKVKQKLSLLYREEVIIYSNGYSAGKDKLIRNHINDDEYSGYLIAEFGCNDKYQYGSMITLYGNYQPLYAFDEKIGVRPVLMLDLNKD